MPLQFLYPSDPFDRKRPDETFLEEWEAARASGLACALFSENDFETEGFAPRPQLNSAAQVVYRGWMMPLERYGKLVAAVQGRGAHMQTSVEAYVLCHHLPNWYTLCQRDTAETVVVADRQAIAATVAQLGWPGFFVKDYVKSLNTGRGSLANTVEDIEDIVLQLVQYRGQLEGGICLRRVEEFQADSEERFFVWEGQAFGRQGTNVPDVVNRCAGAIDSPFFSVDVARRRSGEICVVELGDGQVSDRKAWTAQEFVGMFCR